MNIWFDFFHVSRDFENDEKKVYDLVALKKSWKMSKNILNYYSISEPSIEPNIIFKMNK